ncbi:MAG: Sporulation thiol-disulfide oxidoreductase precursor [Planctomycetota bacterium]
MPRVAVYILITGLLVGCGDPGNVPQKPDAAPVTSGEKDSPSPHIANVGQPEMSRISVGFRAQLDPSFSRGTLAIGAPAPQFTPSSWLRGEPLTEFTPGLVYVVEFWATWCGPCLQSMPHLVELQKQYGTQVRVIGITDESQEILEAFLNEKARGFESTWSELLTCSLAVDSTRELNRSWMEASGQQSIPCAFIVGKSGNIEWIGHPLAIDEPLQSVVAGTWNLNTAREAMIAQQKMKTALDRGDLENAIQSAESLTTLFPESFDHAMTRLELLMRSNRLADANAVAATTLAICRNNPEFLNSLAWLMVTGTDSTEIDLEVAHEAASLANERQQGRDCSILDTLARVKARMGDLNTAIALQKQAIENSPEETQAELVATLQEYEAAIQKNETPAIDRKPATNATPSQSPTDPATKSAEEASPASVPAAGS